MLLTSSILFAQTNSKNSIVGTWSSPKESFGPALARVYATLVLIILRNANQAADYLATIAQDVVPHLPKDRILGSGTNIFSVNNSNELV